MRLPPAGSLGIVPLMLVVAAGACALHPRPEDDSTSPDGSILITESMIAESGALTAWEVIKRKAPQISYRENNAGEPTRVWRRGRGSILLNEAPLLYVDGARISDLKALDQIPASSLESIRILTGLDGTTRYGTNAVGGVILVQTKNGT